MYRSKTNRRRSGALAIVLPVAVLLTASAAAGEIKGIWKPVGPTGATVLSIDFDPANPRRMLAGTYFGGVYESTDQGRTWSHLDNDFTQFSVFTVVFAAKRPSAVYAGTFQGGVYKSTDGGKTWRQSNTGLTDFTVQSLVVSLSDPELLLVVTGTNVFRSTDGGESWTPISQGLENVQARTVAFDSRQSNVAWLGTYGRGVYRSTNGGVSWTPFSKGMGSETVNAISVSPLQQRRIYVSTSGGGAYKLIGDGDTWVPIPVWPDGPRSPVYNIYAHPATVNVLFASTAEGTHVSQNDGASWTLVYSKKMAFTKSDYLGSAFFAAGLENGLVATRDLGKSWTDSTKGMQNVFVGTLAATTENQGVRLHAGTEYGIFTARSDTFEWSAPTLDRRVFTVVPSPDNSDVVFTGTEQFGVWKSNDRAQTWERSTTGIVPNTIYAIEASHSHPAVVYAGTSSGIYISATGGDVWLPGTAVNFPKVITIAVDPQRSLTAYFGGIGGVVLKTTTAGGEYQPAYNGLPAENIICLRISPKNSEQVYAIAADGNLYLTENGGNFWIPIRAEPNDALTLEIDPVKTWVMYLGTAGNGVMKTDTAGIEWQASNDGLRSPYVFSIAVDPKNPDTVYAAGTDGVYKSTNAGQHWDLSSAGLPSGHVMRVLVHPDNSDVLYASVADAGVWRSTDAGATWSALNSGLPVGDTQAIAIDPLISGTVYAGSFLKGMYISRNNGDDWQPGSTDMSLFVRGLAVAPSDASVVYAGTLTGGVFRSKDRGDTWTNTGMRDRIIFSVKVDPRNASHVYIGTSEGVARSTDGGESWTSLGQKASFIFCIAPDPRNRSVIYAGGTAGTLVRSADGGRTWNYANSGLPRRNILALVVTSSDGTVYAALEDAGIYRSGDSGQSWQRTQFGGSEILRVTAITWDARTKALYAASNGQGVLVSFDGMAWGQFNAGLPTNIVSAVVGSGTEPGTVFAGTSDEGLFRSKAGGDWTRVELPNGSKVVYTLALDGEGNLYCATNDGLFKSRDNGATWSEIGAGLPRAQITSFAIHPTDARYQYVTVEGQGVFISEDAGANWRMIADTRSTTPIRIVSLGQNAATVYAGTLGTGVIRSEDAGQNWSDAAAAETVRPFVLTLAIDPQNPAVIYAGTSAGILKSTDGGESWKPAGTTLAGFSVLALAIDPEETSTIYAGTGFGVYVSRDSGANWEQLAYGMFHKNITSLAVDTSDHRIVYAGTEGAGVFRYERP